MQTYNEFQPDDMREFEPEAKIGLIATITPEGLPHLTMITALQARNSRELIFGQFTEGRSKMNVRTNPHTAFLIMNMNKELWRGKARWTHAESEGDDFILFNQKPMFRYNSYFGIHTVHYMDLIETFGREKLPLAGIVRGSLLTKTVKGMLKTGRAESILKPWALNLFNRLDSLKFLAQVGADGFPFIIPVIQCQAADSRRLVFTTSAYGDELARLKTDTPTAVYGLTLQMEDILLRGNFSGYRRALGLRTGLIDIEWVYNSMPPTPGQIYPPVELKPVNSFE